ncbi:type VII secretion target [Nocardia mangyaensis]|uniref:type VII secretion target n=1 Tax=Nocardia mangyaensis TaxID=2213200 RepID=UPI0009042F70|nr:type VII secretion target [Nocardia mangyaensis]
MRKASSYNFTVDPDDIDLAARGLWKIAEDNSRAVSYSAEWLDVQSSGGEIITPVLEQLQAACDVMKANYERLGRVTDSSSTELTNAAKMYRKTDNASAEALDRTYVSE